MLVLALRNQGYFFMIQFRKAQREDATVVAELMILAMEQIVYDFIGETNKEKALAFLKRLIERENNQYSYENTWLVDVDGEIAGSATFYDGGRLEELRKPALDMLKEIYGSVINPQDETQAGEIYIDTIAVSPHFQGKGIGSQILDFLIEEIAQKQQQTLGLLVDFDNPQAKKLYSRKGFEVVGEKRLMNEEHEHMQYKPK